MLTKERVFAGYYYNYCSQAQRPVILEVPVASAWLADTATERLDQSERALPRPTRSAWWKPALLSQSFALISYVSTRPVLLTTQTPPAGTWPKVALGYKAKRTQTRSYFTDNHHVIPPPPKHTHTHTHTHIATATSSSFHIPSKTPRQYTPISQNSTQQFTNRQPTLVLPCKGRLVHSRRGLGEVRFSR